MSSTKTLDILVLGCTGVTGRLTTKYLLHHPKRDSFTFAVTGRSKDKVDRVLEGLGATGQEAPKVLIVDVTKEDQVDAAVKQAKVVINTCGPYWLYGNLVIAACVKHRTHCVDLSGETHWHRHIIQEFHSTAESQGTTLVNCCGFDSIPSEYGTFLGAKALKAFAGHETQIESATSLFKASGGVSKGTLASMLVRMELPKEVRTESEREYTISPVQGKKSPGIQLWYTLYDPETKKNRIGTFFPMIVVNRPIVQRTWGLLQQGDSRDSYGPEFTYNEFMENGSRFLSVLNLLGSATFLALLASSGLARKFIKKVFPDGMGVTDDEKLEKGWFKCDTITKSLPPPNTDKKPLYAKTTFKGKGDPGYLITSVMLTECALMLLNGEGTKKGGVLTPVTAFGEGLMERLKETGRMDFECRVIKSE